MAVNVFFMALMPISHAVSWWLLLMNADDATHFHDAIAAVAAFYCVWALFKILVQGDKKEKGHISMGALAVSATFLQKYPYVVMACNVLVILNFAVVIPFFINRGIEGIVKMVHKEVNSLTMTWGYVFFAYLLSNIVLWCYTLRELLGFKAAADSPLIH